MASGREQMDSASTQLDKPTIRTMAATVLATEANSILRNMTLCFLLIPRGIGQTYRTCHTYIRRNTEKREPARFGVAISVFFSGFQSGSKRSGRYGRSDRPLWHRHFLLPDLPDLLPDLPEGLAAPAKWVSQSLTPTTKDSTGQSKPSTHH